MYTFLAAAFRLGYGRYFPKAPYWLDACHAYSPWAAMLLLYSMVPVPVELSGRQGNIKAAAIQQYVMAEQIKQ